MANDTIKRCTKCGEEKPLDMFHRDKNRADGFFSYCKACVSEYHRANRAHILEVKRKYRQENAESIRAYDRAYKETHHELLLEQYREYNRINAEQRRQYSREYRLGHLEQSRAKCRSHYWANRQIYHHRYILNRHKFQTPEHRLKRREWRQANSDKLLAKNHKRRALLKGIGGHFTIKDIANIAHIQGGHCCYCGRVITLTIEHIIPVTREGSSNDPWNIALACFDCNLSKGNKLLHEWTDRWYLR